MVQFDILPFLYETVSHFLSLFFLKKEFCHTWSIPWHCDIVVLTDDFYVISLRFMVRCRKAKVNLLLNKEYKMVTHNKNYIAFAALYV